MLVWGENVAANRAGAEERRILGNGVWKRGGFAYPTKDGWDVGSILGNMPEDNQLSLFDDLPPPETKR